METDITIESAGNVFLVSPLTDAAKCWIKENVTGKVIYFGKSIVVEHRYIDDLLQGMQEGGLTCIQI